MLVFGEKYKKTKKKLRKYLKIREMRSFNLMCELAVVKICIESAALKKRHVVSRFNDFTVVHDQYNISLAYSRKSMRYDKARASLGHFREGVLNLHFSARVNAGRSLIKYKHWGQGKHDSCDGYQLCLTL